MTVPSPLHLAVALDGVGWHPAAWRQGTARPAELLTAQYWAGAIREAEQGLVDFVTVEDSLGLQSSDFTGPDGRTDQVRGRLDAVLVAASAAPRTRGIGLVPTAVVTHTEPFHISKAIATLDYASMGRAGVNVSVSARPDVARHFGRRDPLPPTAADLYGEAAPELFEEAPELFQEASVLFDEAADYVEVVRRLCSPARSWWWPAPPIRRPTPDC